MSPESRATKLVEVRRVAPGSDWFVVDVGGVRMTGAPLPRRAAEEVANGLVDAITDAIRGAVREAQEAAERALKQALQDALSAPLPGEQVSDAEAEALAGLEAEATPGPWYDHHTDDRAFMSCSTVTTSEAAPDTEHGGGEDAIVAGTLVQSELQIGLDDGRWYVNAALIARLRNLCRGLLSDRERGKRMLHDLVLDGAQERWQAGYEAGLAEQRRRDVDLLRREAADYRDRTMASDAFTLEALAREIEQAHQGPTP